MDVEKVLKRWRLKNAVHLFKLAAKTGDRTWQRAAILQIKQNQKLTCPECGEVFEEKIRTCFGCGYPSAGVNKIEYCCLPRR